MELMIGDETICLRKRSYKRYYLVVGVLAGLAGFLAGILIGRFAIPRTGNNGGQMEEPVFASFEDQHHNTAKIIPTRFSERISADNIRVYLKDITAHPHLAGTTNSERLARELAHFWEQIKLDEVKLTPYDILLSRPNITHPNRIHIVENNNVVFSSEPVEKTLTAADNIDEAIPPFNGFSPAGRVEGDLVYVNYGRYKDFKAITEFMSVNLTDKIVLARYGKVFRGDIVQSAERYGAAGVILYSDPADYTWGESVYPSDWWLPGTAVQRGVVALENGDPLTPGYPSVASAYRPLPNTPLPTLPKIPSHPIGYKDAEVLLRQLQGPVAPESWRGGLNLTYRIGGLRKRDRRIILHVSTRNERATVYNVIGIIRGQTEPDRYLIIGNHRDAWGYGAFDPGSGSAILKELSRVFAEMVAEGWRPRRSIIFCSWGAEEFGLIGSTEWVEQYTKVLGARAVGYFNIDTAVQGNYSLEGNASPLMYNVVYEASKQVPNPDRADREAGLVTVYDKWLKTFPWKEGNESLNRPKLSHLGAGSDYATFYQRLGIPAADLHYVYNTEMFNTVAYHPLYHTAYDTFYAFQSFADNDFQISKTMTHFWAEASMILANSAILPFNVNDYASALTGFANNILGEFGPILEHVANVTLADLKKAVAAFETEARNFHLRMCKPNEYSPSQLRLINDQLMQLERAFIDPLGLPGRPLSRHVVFAPSAVNSYAGSSFPGLVDVLSQMRSARRREGGWELVRQQWSVVVFTIMSAASTLREVTGFMADYFQ